MTSSDPRSGIPLCVCHRRAAHVAQPAGSLDSSDSVTPSDPAVRRTITGMLDVRRKSFSDMWIACKFQTNNKIRTSYTF